MFTLITYPMIGYIGSIYKIFWYTYTTFCTFLFFKYLGMMMIAITPTFPVATTLQSAFYTTFNLFAGFLVPLKVHAFVLYFLEYVYICIYIYVYICGGYFAADSKMVDLVILFNTDILVIKRITYIPIWRYEERN